MALSSLKRQTAASSGDTRPTNRSGYEAGSKISLMGRRTCVSASALSLDAQPAQAERVVRRISRPVCGIGISSPKNVTNNQSLWLLVTLRTNYSSPITLLLSWYCSCVWQWQYKLIACWYKNSGHAGRKFQDILILQ